MSFKPLLLSLAASLPLAACDSMQMHHDHDHAAAITIPAGAVDLHNTVCPVAGEKISNENYIAVYQNKVYHFCCGDCPKDFEKDPAKYAKLVADNPAKYGVK